MAVGLGHGEPGCCGTRLRDLQAGVDVAAVSSEVIQGWMVRIKVVLPHGCGGSSRLWDGVL